MAGEYWLPQVFDDAIETEAPAGRYDRDWEHQGENIVPEGLLENDPRYDGTLPYAGATDEESDDRKARARDFRSDERNARDYVDRTTGVSATGVDHPIKDVLFEASAETWSDTIDAPTTEEIEGAYDDDNLANDNRPAGMFGSNLPIGR